MVGVDGLLECSPPHCPNNHDKAGGKGNPAWERGNSTYGTLRGHAFALDTASTASSA